jgi:hypothetical protein
MGYYMSTDNLKYVGLASQNDSDKVRISGLKQVSPKQKFASVNKLYFILNID